MDIIKVSRPWGSFERFTHNEPSTVKLLYVKKGESLSLQYHNHRDEFWKIIVGNPDITIGENVYHAHAGEEYNAPVKTNHRVSAPIDDVVFLEIAFGDFDEEDIVHIEDKYNRV